MEHNIKDTTLYIPTRPGPLPFAIVHPKTKRRPAMRPNGEATTRRVTLEEMERLWK